MERYARGLVRALGEQGIDVSLASGAPGWWDKSRGLSLAIGAPSNARRIDGWIAPNLSAEEAARQPRGPLAIAALYPEVEPPLAAIPFAVPDAFYAPGDGTAVFQVTKRLHLEQRPRIVLMGPYRDGHGLTVALDAMRQLLAVDGELVWIDGLGLRAQFAPVIQRLRLTERVIFLPALPDDDVAAVLLGSDVAIVPERTTDFAYWIPWCHAAGLPVVVMDSPGARAAMGTAALIVDPARDDGLKNAIQEILQNAATHRHLITRGMAQAECYRSKRVAEAFLGWLGQHHLADDV